jgi:integrase
MTTYATGLRFSEVSELRPGDIDSERMVIQVHGGKGAKDRLVPLPTVLHPTLREHWQLERPTTNTAMRFRSTEFFRTRRSLADFQRRLTAAARARSFDKVVHCEPPDSGELD